MPVLNWVVTTKVKRMIENYVADHKEFFWYRPRRDVLELRVVTFSYENGNFRSRCLWRFEPFSDEDVNDARRLHNAVLSLHPERTRHSALNDIEKILSDFWFDGIIAKTGVTAGG